MRDDWEALALLYDLGLGQFHRDATALFSLRGIPIDDDLTDEVR